ncbi:uncharacterized protein LOC142635633 [Castanea sativa]|uniref:uncharacterized protein LOC142635633 n=1 Tax=Castanea sativa TaxID=21020 RepID=UPI003ADAA0E8
MEMKQQHSQLALVSMVLQLLLILWLVISPVVACPTYGRDCKSCIRNELKFSCPPCAPILRCMARCLWGGNSRYDCVKRCDCNTGYPTLADCKRCMLKCKCSCMG